MRYGVVLSGFTREYKSSNVLHRIHHYQGQILISDGQNSKVLDEFTVSVLKTNKQALALLHKQHAEERAMQERFTQELSAIGGKHCSESLTWMADNEHYPVRWLDDIDAALKEYTPLPVKRKISESVAI